jgi:hypothetical protein
MSYLKTYDKETYKLFLRVQKNMIDEMNLWHRSDEINITITLAEYMMIKYQCAREYECKRELERERERECERNRQK